MQTVQRPPLLSVISLLGAIASIVGVLVAAPTLESKFVHLGYSILLIILVAVSVYTYMRQRKVAAQHKGEAVELQQELRTHRSSEYAAARLLRSYSPNSSTGYKRGYLLGCLGFFEQHQTEWPTTFAKARDLVDKALNLEGFAIMNEEEYVREACNAVNAMLKAISDDPAKAAS